MDEKEMWENSEPYQDEKAENYFTKLHNTALYMRMMADFEKDLEKWLEGN